MSERITNLYRQYINMPMANRIELSRRSYKKMESEFSKVFDSFKAYNYAIDAALLICYFAIISEKTYDLFIKTTGKSPSYYDFSNNASKLARRQSELVGYVKRSQDLMVAVSYYALTICACKESLTERDMNIINKFLGKIPV